MSESNFMLLQPSARKEIFGPSLRAEGRSLRVRLFMAIVLSVLAVATLLIHYFTPFAWNVSATLAVQSLSVPGLQELMRLISGFGNAPKVIAITVIALVACNRRREAVFLTWSGLGGWLLAMQLKHLFAAPRPDAGVVDCVSSVAHRQFPFRPSGFLRLLFSAFSFSSLARS